MSVSQDQLLKFLILFVIMNVLLDYLFLIAVGVFHRANKKKIKELEAEVKRLRNFEGTTT